MITTRTFTLAASTSVVVLLAACSSSSSGTSPAAGGDGGGSSTTSGTCEKITLADAQALVPPIVSQSDPDSVKCVYVLADGKTLEVKDFANDADLKYYKTTSLPNDHAITGIGDQAYWNEVLEGPTPPNSAPELAAHKGNATCVIQSNDPPDTTLKTSSQTALYTIDPADALAYVQLMGKVCNDIFANQSNQ